MTTVYLPPTSSVLWDSNEPQIIQERPPNRAAIYYDSRWGGETFIQDPTDLVISTRKSIGDIPGVMASGINRISVNSVGFYNSIPNVNPRNNQIIFFSEVSGLEHEVFLTEGFYNSSDIMTEIETAMNSVSGASGLTFSSALKYPGGNTYILTSVGGGFRIISTCNAVTRGFITYNFEVNSFNTGQITVGPISGYYTRFIDFLSNNITRYNKISAVSNNSRNSLIFRCFFDEPEKTNTIANFRRNEYINTFNFNPDEALYEIDIKLIDQFGEPLYIPDDYGFANFWYDIEFVFE